MKSAPRSALRWFGLALVLLLASCSNLKLAYNQGPELAYWWIDAYADFNGNQKPQAREALKGFFRWNRQEQLDDYVATLASVESHINASVTPAQVCQWYDQALTHVDAAAEQALPSVVALARTMTAEQFQHMAERYEKKNRDWIKDHMQESADDRLKASLKRSREWTDLIYGDIDKAQRDQLSAGLAQSPFDPRMALVERQARQQEMLQVLRKISTGALSTEEANASVRTVIRHFRQSPDTAMQAQQQKVRAHQCTMTAQLHNTTTPPQRAAATKRLRGWQDDLRTLNAAAAS